MWYEIDGIGRAPEDFDPVWNIKKLIFKEGTTRHPIYDNGEYAICPVCPEGKEFVLKGLTKDRTIVNNGKEPYLIFFVKVDLQIGQEPLAKHAALLCPACGYKYDVNKGKEVESWEIVSRD